MCLDKRWIEINERDTLRSGASEAGQSDQVPPGAMAAARERIRDAGGILRVWAVLYEDTYETDLGDGLYLHVRGLALNRADALRLAALGKDEHMSEWHVREYRLGLANGVPALLTKLAPASEQFVTICMFVEILSEIPPGKSFSKLMIGSAWKGRRSGAHMVELP